MIDLGELRKEFPHLTGIAPVAAGGQKEVCRAEFAGKAVALKLILPTPGSEQRTTREIEAIRQISADNIPKVFETGERILSGQKRHYIIEQFIEGETYRAKLLAQPIRDFSEVLELTKVLLDAAANFERLRLVHRDIKPENILVDNASKIWILDFGIARHLNLSSLTPTGGFGIGTIGYAPPEQFRNQKAEIDARADLYAIGIVAHEALTGFHYYLRGAHDILAVIHKMDRLDMPRLAIPEDPRSEFSDFIATLCQRYPSRRPRSAAEAVGWYQSIYGALKRNA